MFNFLRRHSKSKMPTNKGSSSTFSKSLTAIAVPGVYLFYKYSEFKRQQHEIHRNKVTEKELDHLNHKIDKLLAKIDDKDTENTSAYEMATAENPEDEECVICMSAKATMQTFPCGHTVICRKCFIKTIQVAVSQRCLPLKCVICRTRILKLRQSATVKMPTAKNPGRKSQSAYTRFTKQSKVYAK